MYKFIALQSVHFEVFTKGTPFRVLFVNFTCHLHSFICTILNFPYASLILIQKRVNSGKCEYNKTGGKNHGNAGQFGAMALICLFGETFKGFFYNN